MTEADRLIRIWGKTAPDDPNRFHPLLFHLADVANVARLLWRERLGEGVRARMAGAMGLAPEDAERVICLLAGLHDLGKASAFQAKVRELWGPLADLGSSMSPDGARHRHASMTFALLPDLVEQEACGFVATRAVAKRLAQILGGHHGFFPPAVEVSDRQKPGDAECGGPEWDSLRVLLCRSLAALLYQGPHLPVVRTPRLTESAMAPLLGGFVSVADWVGSSADHFSPTGSGLAPAAYASSTREAAARALAVFGWTPRPAYAGPAPFGAIFRARDGAPFAPNAVQRTVLKFADTTTSPYLMIVEAAMGDGKTEAALYSGDRALCSGLADGLYVAMPTQSTGDAMFRRVLDGYLRTRGHKNVHIQLVHGGSLMSDDLRPLLQAASSDEDNPDGDGAVTAESWFMPSKRALLAPMGVGTIDQALLGAVQAKHWFVRLFGLAGKVVIFDEVHAYDTYMSSLLERLLAWLHEIGCTVILLSATLPAERRRSLLNAWGAQGDPPEVAYPRVTIAREGVLLAEASGSDRAEWNVDLEWASTDLNRLAGRIRKDLPSGGCAVVICNTVPRAQEAERQLRQSLRDEGWLVMLVHARMPARWRSCRESRLLRFLGKGGNRPQKIVVVGTSVLEQSLDYDADWMASDIAPADLLLQRMGRLWRHPRRSRPAAQPRFVVMCDADASGVPTFARGMARKGARGGVYEEYVLLRSFLALQRGALDSQKLLSSSGSLRMPAAIEPIVNLTYDTEGPDGVSEVWRSALDDARQEMERSRDDYRRKAEGVMVPHPSCGLAEVIDPVTLDNTSRQLYDDEDPKVHETVRAATRLGDPAIRVVCCGTMESGLSLAPDVPAGASPKQVKKALDFSVSVGNRTLFHALLSQPPPPEWRKQAALKYCRRLEFVGGETQLAGYRLRIDRKGGLMFEKEGDADGS